MNRYSTLGNRIVAAIIDVIVVSPIIIFSLLFSEYDSPDWMGLLIIPFESVIFVGYFTLLHWKYGQTVGKMVAKVRVVDNSGGPITFAQAFLRDIAEITYSLIWLAVSFSMVRFGFGLKSEEFLTATDYLLIPYLLWIIVDTVVCLRSSKRRALHDLIAGTVVVRLDVPAETEPLNHTPPPPSHYKEVVS